MEIYSPQERCFAYFYAAEVCAAQIGELENIVLVTSISERLPSPPCLAISDTLSDSPVYRDAIFQIQFLTALRGICSALFLVSNRRFPVTCILKWIRFVSPLHVSTGTKSERPSSAVTNGPFTKSSIVFPGRLSPIQTSTRSASRVMNVFRYVFTFGVCLVVSDECVEGAFSPSTIYYRCEAVVARTFSSTPFESLGWTLGRPTTPGASRRFFLDTDD